MINFEAAKRAYTNRFTMEHVPTWALNARAIAAERRRGSTRRSTGPTASGSRIPCFRRTKCVTALTALARTRRGR